MEPRYFSVWLRLFGCDLYGMKEYRRHLEAAECHRVTYHDLRHTLGTLLRDTGVQRDNIAAILGHKDESTTAIYAKVTLKLQRTELSKLRLDLDRAKVIAMPMVASTRPRSGRLSYDLATVDAKRGAGQRQLPGIIEPPIRIERTTYGLRNPGAAEGSREVAPDLGNRVATDLADRARELLRAVGDGRPVARDEALAIADEVLATPLARAALALRESEDAFFVARAIELAGAVIGQAALASTERRGDSRATT